MPIVVVDSTRGSQLSHNTYAIVYTPSWLRLRNQFQWRTTATTLKAVSVMKEYFMSAPIPEKPIRAQRCFYTLKALNIYGTKPLGDARFSPISRDVLSKHREELIRYLAINPVVAWDWSVSWAESRAMAEAYPDELVSMYRRLRSHMTTRGKPKPELQYFLYIIEAVAEESNLSLEFK